MTNREKLIEIIKSIPTIVNSVEEWADYLLKNDVIAPPVKVGTEVFFVAEWDKDVYRVIKGTLISYSLDAKSLWFYCRYDCGLNYWHPIDNFGERVFANKEEAEKALKERESK